MRLNRYWRYDHNYNVFSQHRRDHLASMCNQAIMLITDGVPDSYADIYRRFNWKNSTEPPFPVRVFTYLIGRDGVDFRDTRWMACANHGKSLLWRIIKVVELRWINSRFHYFKGYYVQLTTMQDVKEQVFHYVNVLARPLVLKNSKKIAWTSLYAHKTVSNVVTLDFIDWNKLIKRHAALLRTLKLSIAIGKRNKTSNKKKTQCNIETIGDYF